MDKELKQDAKKVELKEDELSGVSGGKEMTSFKNSRQIADDESFFNPIPYIVGDRKDM